MFCSFVLNWLAKNVFVSGPFCGVDGFRVVLQKMCSFVVFGSVLLQGFLGVMTFLLAFNHTGCLLCKAKDKR